MNVLLLIVVSFCTFCQALSDTQPLISDDCEGVPAAFGNFDNDKNTDAFVIAGNGKSFSILRGFKNEPLLRPSTAWSCKLDRNSKEDDERIISLMPADFHGMAMMDVLVVTKFGSNLNLYLVKGDKSSLNCTNGLLHHAPFAEVRSEPLLMDFDGDMISDVIAHDTDGKRYIWIFKLNATYSKKEYFGQDAFAVPNSNAFVDLNHDSIPDIFISAENNMEFWYMDNKTFSTIPVQGIYPDTSKYKIRGQSTFMDINSDGKIDHIMPVCYDSNCDSSGILAFYEQHRWIEIAKSFNDTDDASQRLSFVKAQENFGGFSFPMTLRQADIDGDGYPDVIAIMKYTGKKSSSKVLVLRNVPTDSSTGSNELNRTFVPYGVIKVSEDRKPVVVSFFDLYEDGKPDILVGTVDKKKETAADKDWRLTAIVNTQMVDACFLKVMVASGLCYDDCTSVKGTQQTSIEPSTNSPTSQVAYGTNQPGPNVCYELIDSDGAVRRGCQGQLTQSASFALQMPYLIFGLGSTPNFIDTLTATIPSPGTENKRSQSWTQLVPDATVVLIPFPPDNPHQWRHKLFYTPSDIVLSTLITLASICCLLILIIAALHRKEILEDLAEHEEYKRHWPDSR